MASLFHVNFEDFSIKLYVGLNFSLAPDPEITVSPLSAQRLLSLVAEAHVCSMAHGGSGWRRPGRGPGAFATHIQ